MGVVPVRCGVTLRNPQPLTNLANGCMVARISARESSMHSTHQQDFLDAAMTLRSAVAALEDRGVIVTGSEPWDSSAKEYLRHLAAHFVRADERLAPLEFELLSAFYADGTTFHEEYELAKHVALQSPEFLERCPAFLTAACERAPDLAADIRRSIRRLVGSVIAADGISERRERALANAYLRLEELAMPSGTADY